MNKRSKLKFVRVKKNLEFKKPDDGKSETSSNLSRNSFLVEVEHNKDIGVKLRKNIEEKFERSSVNASYRFPRIECDQRAFPDIRLDRKTKYRSGGSERTRISLAGCCVEARSLELGTGKLLKIPVLTKRSVNISKREAINSLTPVPFFRDMRKSYAENRKTPSPSPYWKHSLLDKKRLL